MVEIYKKDQRCINCYYSRPYPPPTLTKPEPREISLFWGLIKYHEEPDIDEFFPYAMQKGKYDHSVKCLFNPRHIEKDKMSWCGQWKLKQESKD